MSTFGAWLSLPFDWMVRSTGKANLHNDTLKRLPAIDKNHLVSIRALLLNCLNRDYADLWREAWYDAYLTDGWLSSDPRLTKWADHLAAGSEWKWETPLRTQLDRRQALVELDVIVTKALGSVSWMRRNRLRLSYFLAMMSSTWRFSAGSRVSSISYPKSAHAPARRKSSSKPASNRHLRSRGRARH